MNITRNDVRRCVGILLFSCIALSAIACAPQTAQEPPASSDSSDKATAIAFTWSEESACETCHDSVTQSFDDDASVASLHTSLKSDCFSCHSDKEGLQKAHAKVTLESKKKSLSLKKTSVTPDACTTCHELGALSATTESSTILTDSNGLTVNPHSLPVSSEHDALSCSSCHPLHQSKGPDSIAPGVCKNCHHADVYECGTCHEV